LPPIGTDAANAHCRARAGQFLLRSRSMTRFDDELEYVCAWGRWRIDQARNEPELHEPAPRPVAPAHRERAAPQRTRTRRGRARLRLVSAPAGVVR